MVDGVARPRVDDVAHDAAVHPAHVAVVAAGGHAPGGEREARDRGPRREGHGGERVAPRRGQGVVHADAPGDALGVAPAQDQLPADLDHELRVAGLLEDPGGDVDAVALGHGGGVHLEAVGGAGDPALAQVEGVHPEEREALRHLRRGGGLPLHLVRAEAPEPGEGADGRVEGALGGGVQAPRELEDREGVGGGRLPGVDRRPVEPRQVAVVLPGAEGPVDLVEPRLDEGADALRVLPGLQGHDRGPGGPHAGAADPDRRGDLDPAAAGGEEQRREEGEEGERGGGGLHGNEGGRRGGDRRAALRSGVGRVSRRSRRGRSSRGRRRCRPASGGPPGSSSAGRRGSTRTPRAPGGRSGSSRARPGG